MFSVDWAEIKDVVDNRNGYLQYSETPNRYLLQIAVGNFILQSNIKKEIPRNADQVDFEDNYKASANQLNVQPTEVMGRNPSDNLTAIPVSGMVHENSTSTPLAANATFTGSFYKCCNYTSISIAMLTDQYSALNGVSIEYSTDGTEAGIIRTLRTTATPHPDGIFVALPCEGQFFRIKYTNGAVAQTTFQLHTEVKTAPSGQAAIPIASPLEDLNSALLTRSVIAGKNADTGEYQNVGVVDGRVQVEAIQLPQQLDERFQLYAKNGTNDNMAVNGSSTPVEFLVNGAATHDRLVDFMSFQAFDNGIKIDKFLGQNGELTNGIIVEVKSNDVVSQFLPIKNTTEFNSVFALGPARSFQLLFASGSDSMVATFGPSAPFLLKKQGTFATDDYVKVIIQDNLNDIIRFKFTVTGRVVED